MEYNEYMLRKREIISSLDSKENKSLSLFLIWLEYVNIRSENIVIDKTDLRFNNLNKQNHEKKT